MPADIQMNVRETKIYSLPKGYKILGNVSFAYLLHPHVNTPQNMASSCTEHRFDNISCTKIIFLYRQVGYNTDPEVLRDEPQAGDVWFTPERLDRQGLISVRPDF